MITDFYEYGWGQSFHFAPRNKGESFDVRACCRDGAAPHRRTIATPR
jgi:hypothetical protein